MNSAHIHLLLNHIPVLGTLFGLLLLGWGMVRRNEGIQRAALTACVFAALIAVPVYVTGEPAEDIVEHLIGTSGAAIDTHEEAALASLIAIELLGVAALTTLALRRFARWARLLTTVSLIFALVTTGLMAWTANLGGRIRHAELGAASVQPEPDEDR